MDLRAKLAQLRTMEPPAAWFEPPPSAAIAMQESVHERTDPRDGLARLRTTEAPATLSDSPPSAAGEVQGSLSPRADLRAKLAQMRTMEPPVAWFEPPPSAAIAALQTVPEQADLRDGPAIPRAMEPPAKLSGLPPSATDEVQGTLSPHADLRAKLARLRTMEPPAAWFEPPPSAAIEVRDSALERADLRDALAIPRAVEPPATLSESPLAAIEVECPAPSERTDFRAGQAHLRTMDPPAAVLESPPSAAIEVGQPAPRERTGLRAKLARLRAMEPPVVLSEPQPLAADEGGEPANKRADLRAKLARLRTMEPPAALFEAPPSTAERAASGAFSSHKGERIAQLRSMIAAIAARESRRAPPAPEKSEAKPPPWAQENTDQGPLHVCARYLEPGHHHGHAPVRSALSALPATLPSLVCDADYADIDLRRALYLDTETTGLAGGTGTIAFLVGLARFEDESLCLEQLVVPQLGSEVPMLARLAQRIAAASCIVTYNGKSFDWPLLRTRFVLARLPIPALPPHVDLLHVCRRLWKKRLASVRLVDMEREVLRFEREDDLPGSEIPTRYFEFLRGGSPERLAPVLEHNQNDIIALPALLGALLQQYEGDRSLCAAGDALYFGKLALRARDCERARSFGEQALSHSTCPREARAALTLCAEIEHKLGSIAAALELLERAAALETPDGDPVDELAKAQLHFTLAKLYEHAQHDLARALRHARNTELVEGPVLHGRRLGRLYRRLLRTTPRASRSSA